MRAVNKRINATNIKTLIPPIDATLSLFQRLWKQAKRVIQIMYLIVGAEIKLTKSNREIFNQWGFGIRNICFRKNVFNSTTYKGSSKHNVKRIVMSIRQTNEGFFMVFLCITTTNNQPHNMSDLPNNTKNINSKKSFVCWIWIRPTDTCPAIKQINLQISR